MSNNLKDALTVLGDAEKLVNTLVNINKKGFTLDDGADLIAMFAPSIEHKAMGYAPLADAVLQAYDGYRYTMTQRGIDASTLQATTGPNETVEGNTPHE